MSDGVPDGVPDGVDAKSPRLGAVLEAIDAANAADPTLEETEDGRQPAALLYGRRMSAELARLCPDASAHLQIAARGQHVERWAIPRHSYPEGRAGYLAWRKAQAERHGARVAEFMAAAGYGPEACARVAAMLRKEGLKSDPEVQMLEDVICFVFLRWYFADFAAGRSPEQVYRIVAKTARKMSAAARARVVEEFDLPAELRPAVTA